MRTTATRNEHDPETHAPEPVLFLAVARSAKTWQLGFPTGHGQKPRERPRTARDRKGLRDAVPQATARCGLGETAPGVSGDAAGRAGFWRHRFLQAHGIPNAGGDASAIAVTRRRRRAKREGLDVRQVVRRLRRCHHGARQV